MEFRRRMEETGTGTTMTGITTFTRTTTTSRTRGYFGTVFSFR